ncbi:MAG TPA: caspase family protein, partial [Herpetosiphonaceae bacterium]|nr:caspase family protein [Herpetosiphonaceae bacterium]
METNRSIWALLVGIDEYRDKPLAGCVNDVEALRDYLIGDLGVPERQVATLCNRQATRAGILDAFQDFLTFNPAIRPGDQILFHFSGHGSRMRDPDGIEPDGLNETLVPYDSRTANAYDIPDKTLAGLLEQLVAAKGSNVTVMLDCCHSGSGTRGPARVRGIDPDPRRPPPGLDSERLAARGASYHGWHGPGESYVLLAACRDRETSQEYPAPGREGRTAWYGPLTYFVLQGLEHLPPSATYADLYESIAYRINAANPGQMPQCEGDRDRAVFGEARMRRAPFFLIHELGGRQFQLNGGLIHGVAEGTEFTVYPGPHRAEPGSPAAIGRAIAERTSA